MTRMDRYMGLIGHAYYGPLIKKLQKRDADSIVEFIKTHGSETPAEWTASVRVHLIQSDHKNKFLIDDVLTSLM